LPSIPAKKVSREKKKEGEQRERKRGIQTPPFLEKIERRKEDRKNLLFSETSVSNGPANKM
jgi:hypothetical protein